MLEPNAHVQLFSKKVHCSRAELIIVSESLAVHYYKTVVQERMMSGPPVTVEPPSEKARFESLLKWVSQ